MRLSKSVSAWYPAVLCLAIAVSACSAGTASARNTADQADNVRQASLPTQLLPNEQNTVDIVKRYKYSVVAVNVTVEGKAVNPLQGMPPQAQQFFKQFINPRAQQRHMERAAGSGFVVDRDGEILTNYHVVGEALKNNSIDIRDGASIKVQFSGGKLLPVRVVGVNQSYDLALLQLRNPKQLPAEAKSMPLADSDEIQVGEKAIAIGNPFTLQSTVTEGVVSAVNREQAAKVSGVPIEYIQTDAAINPGNSGGPLINSQGQVIGINDEILAPHGTFIGVGFAIPSNVIRENLPHLKAGGFIKKARMGVEIVALKKYPRSLRRQLHLPDHGMMIVAVEPHSPAAKAGLQGAQFTVNTDEGQLPAGGDIIIKADGHELTTGSELQKLVFGKSAGSKIKLEILHNGRKKMVTVTLAVLKSEPGH